MIPMAAVITENDLFAYRKVGVKRVFLYNCHCVWYDCIWIVNSFFEKLIAMLAITNIDFWNWNKLLFLHFSCF